MFMHKCKVRVELNFVFNHEKYFIRNEVGLLKNKGKEFYVWKSLDGNYINIEI